MALDPDSQSVKFVKPDVLNSASLSVGEDHGPTDKLRASLIERAEDVETWSSISMSALSVT